MHTVIKKLNLMSPFCFLDLVRYNVTEFEFCDKQRWLAKFGLQIFWKNFVSFWSQNFDSTLNLMFSSDLLY